MKRGKPGSRHSLLLYKRVMDRLWASTLLLGAILLIVWGWSWSSAAQLFQSQDSIWLFVGACVALSFAIFAFFGRRVAYVQAHKDHIRLVTPFLRTNISYQRVRSVHPTDFHKLFQPSKSGWAQRRVLDPFYGKTAVVVELKGYPLPPFLLRFFLAPQMFSPLTTGFVLLVPDWMAFTTEIDSFRGTWSQINNRRQAAPGNLW